MRKKFEYAPGIPGYGSKGTDGSAGLTGLSIYFSSYNGLTEGLIIKGKIENNQLLRDPAESLPQSRIYQEGDFFIDINGRVFEINFEYENLFSETGQQLDTTGFFEQGRSNQGTIGIDDYQGYVNSFTMTNRFLIDIAYDNDPAPTIKSYGANPGIDYTTNIYGLEAIDFAQIKYVNFKTGNYHPYTIWSNSILDEPEKTIALVKEDGKNVWRWGNMDNLTLRDVSLILDFKDILTDGTLKGNNGPLNISSFLADASAIFTGDIYVPNPTTGTQALNMQTGDTRYLSSVAAYVREASLGSGFLWDSGGFLTVGFNFLEEDPSNLILKGDIIPDVGSAYKIGDTDYTLSELHTDSLYIEDNKVIFKDETDASTLNITTSKDKNIHISTTGDGISELSSVEKVLIRIKEAESEIEDFGYGIDIPGAPGDCTVSTEEWEFKEVTNPATGRTWMDRNLGAVRVAQSMYDASAYGHLFQWGRRDEGHQLRDSGTRSPEDRTVSNTPCNSEFQRTDNYYENWRAHIVGSSYYQVSNDHLWQEDTRINIPGPENYRLPTVEEWEEEMATWDSQDAYGAFKSPLKITLAGHRKGENAAIIFEGQHGFYACSSTYYDSTVAGGTWRQRNMHITPSSADSDNSYYGYGESVRLIKIKSFWYKDEWWEYEEVTNPATGRTWMDRNLGAVRPAGAYDDASAYGDLFQWGRLDDGHQERTSDTTATLSPTDVPGHDEFIYTPSVDPFDWRNPQNNNLWQGEDGINVPAPPGWRLPTESELVEEVATWESENIAGAILSPLKLPAGGYRRYYFNGDIVEQSQVAKYWSSDIMSSNARALIFNSGDASMNSNYRAYGASVRLIKVDKDIEISNEKPGKLKFSTLNGGSSEFNTKVKSEKGFYIDENTHFTKDDDDNLIITEKGEARTLDSIKGVRILTEDTSILDTDGGKYLRYTGGIPISCKVPKDINVPLYTPITIRQAAAGIVTITYDDPSVVLNGEPATDGQHTSLQIMRIEDVDSGNNMWDIIGGI